MNDVPRRYNGAQRIVLDDRHQTIIPLHYVGGLIHLPMWKPSPMDLLTMNIVDLTPNRPWRPLRDETDSYLREE